MMETKDVIMLVSIGVTMAGTVWKVTVELTKVIGSIKTLKAILTGSLDGKVDKEKFNEQRLNCNAIWQLKADKKEFDILDSKVTGIDGEMIELDAKLNEHSRRIDKLETKN